MGTMTKAKKSTTKFVICEHDDTDTSVYTLSEKETRDLVCEYAAGSWERPKQELLW
jgi:hypothetical protein